MKNIKVMIGMSTAIIFCAFVGPAYAQEASQAQNASQAKDSPAKDNDAFTVETVSGEVTAIDKDFISIVYNHDYDTGIEYEIMVPLEKSTVLKHKRNLAEIKVGDLVSVEYEKPIEGSKRKVKAKIISFIQSGISGLTTDVTQ